MTLHVLDLFFTLLFSQLTDHPTSLAVPLIQRLLLRVFDLASVVLAVDRALAKLASEDEISVRRLV